MKAGQRMTILAIDGQGNDTKPFVELLKSTGRLMDCNSMVLLTSDRGAKDAEVDVVQIQALDYLGYSRFCIEDLHKYVHREFAFMVQLDGFIVDRDLWTDAFLEYDYIGAPWGSRWTRPIADSVRVGNGGFCIRHRRLFEETAKLKWTSDWSDFRMPAKNTLRFPDWRYRVPKKHWGNEDAYICMVRRKELEAAGIRFAPVELAARFSIQPGKPHSTSHTMDNVFGFHGRKLIPQAVQVMKRKNTSLPYKGLPDTKTT